MSIYSQSLHEYNFNLLWLFPNILTVPPFQTKQDNSKVYPITCHEDTDREQRYSYPLSLILALYQGGWLMPYPNHFTLENEPVPIVLEAG
jgi:hypothetical protein